MPKKVKTLDRHTLEQAIACVPTNWTDDILAGPNAALKGNGGAWGCPDIERVLRAVKARMEALTPVSKD